MIMWLTFRAANSSLGLLFYRANFSFVPSRDVREFSLKRENYEIPFHPFFFFSSLYNLRGTNFSPRPKGQKESTGMAIGGSFQCALNRDCLIFYYIIYFIEAFTKKNEIAPE